MLGDVAVSTLYDAEWDVRVTLHTAARHQARLARPDMLPLIDCSPDLPGRYAVSETAQRGTGGAASAVLTERLERSVDKPHNASCVRVTWSGGLSTPSYFV